MKLFVWKNVLCDYSCGMIGIVGTTLNRALKSVEKKMNKAIEENRNSRSDGYGNVPSISGSLQYLPHNHFDEIKDRAPDEIHDLKTGTIITDWGSA